MQFEFETIYNQRAVTAMARALRKTIRKKKNRRSCILGSVISAAGLLLVIKSASEGDFFSFNAIVTLIAVIAMITAMIWQDAMNGYFARKKVLPGTERSKSVFTEEEFCSETDVGKTEWKYDKIIGLAETKDYFVFLFSTSHAQVHDKQTLAGGSTEEFRRFIEETTGLKMQKV